MVMSHIYDETACQFDFLQRNMSEKQLVDVLVM